MIEKSMRKKVHYRVLTYVKKDLVEFFVRMDM
jgi:hypothetical protein